ncbi:hypothetical protein BKA93DRAFT_811289 [Sparassis latifolia]
MKTIIVARPLADDISQSIRWDHHESTVPTFYKMPVANTLLNSIINAQLPPEQIVVHALTVPVPNPMVLFGKECGLW